MDFENDSLGLIAGVERPIDLAIVSKASGSLLKTASIKSNDLTLKLPRVVSFLVCYILGSGKWILSDCHDSVVVILLNIFVSRWDLLLRSDISI